MTRGHTLTEPVARGPALRLWLAAGLLVALAAASYLNSLGSPFFFDDDASIRENASIRRLDQLGAVLAPPSAAGAGVAGRPVVNLSLAINYAVGGLEVRGYHLVNIALHALAALALFGLLRRILLSPPLAARFGAAALPLAFLTAAGWAVHPLQTESVTCVIQRTELLVGLFYLLTLYAVCRTFDSPSRRWPFLAFASCLVGMGSKEVMVSAPLLALLLDRTFGAGTFRAAWTARRPLYLGLAATWLLLAWLVLSAGGTRGNAAGFGLGVTWWSYLFKQCEAILTYVKLASWPHPLVVFYGNDVVTDFTAIAPQFAVLTLAALGTAYALWRRPWLGFAGLWFFALLAPSSSVVPLITQTMAEHRMYLPLAAPLVLAVCAAYTVGGRRVFVPLAAIAVGFVALTIRRNEDYRSPIAIWTDTVVKRPAHPGARVNLGAALREAGRRDEAAQQLLEALRLEPNLSEAHNNVASILLEAGRPADAIPFAEAALRQKPAFAAAHNNLGSALTQTGRVAEGERHFLEALRLNPELAPALSNLAGILLRSGRAADALSRAEAALRLDPALPDALANAAHALIALRRPGEAIPHLQAFVRLKPNDAVSWSNLGASLYQIGRTAEAIEPLRIAARLQPELFDAHHNLGSVLLQNGRPEEGVASYRTALRIDPSSVDAHCNLGIALLRLGRNAEAVAAFQAALRLQPDHAQARAHLQHVTGLIEKGSR